MTLDFDFDLEDFLTLPAEKAVTDLSNFVTWFPELGFPVVPNPNSLNKLKEQIQVEIQIIKSRSQFKGTVYERNNWTTATVYFQENLCAILRNPAADDFYPNRFIVDPEGFTQLIKYLFKLLSPEETQASNPVDDRFCRMFGGEILSQPLELEVPALNLELLKQALFNDFLI